MRRWPLLLVLVGCGGAGDDEAACYLRAADREVNCAAGACDICPTFELCSDGDRDGDGCWVSGKLERCEDECVDDNECPGVCP